MPRQLAVVLGLLMLYGCGDDEAIDPETFQVAQFETTDRFVLSAGEFRTVSGADLIVIFHGVQQDSRCPPDVVCIWEGDAEANVGIAPPVDGGDERLAILHTNRNVGPDTTALGPDHVLRLIELRPASAAEAQSAYRATFRIERR